MSRSVEAELKNNFDEVARAEGIIEAFAEENGLPLAAANALSLCVEEILTNIVKYAFDDGAEHLIKLRLSVEEGVAEAEVRDDGKPFNPFAQPPPDTTLPLEDRKIGGLGLHLIRRMMDGLDYRRQAGENILSMRKRI